MALFGRYSACQFVTWCLRLVSSWASVWGRSSPASSDWPFGRFFADAPRATVRGGSRPAPPACLGRQLRMLLENFEMGSPHNAICSIWHNLLILHLHWTDVVEVVHIAQWIFTSQHSCQLILKLPSQHQYAKHQNWWKMQIQNGQAICKLNSSPS